MSVPVFSLFKDVRSCLTKEDIMREGTLSYTVSKRDKKVEVLDKDGKKVEVVDPHSVAVIRDGAVGIHSIIGSVGPKFGLLQNDDVLAFCEAFTKKGEAAFHSVAAPNLGEKIFILMRQPAVVDVAGGDTVTSYFCVTSAHDGSSCLNAIPMYLRDYNQTVLTPPYSSPAFRIKHSKNASRNLEAAKRVLGKMSQYFQDYTNKFVGFATLKMSDDEVRKYLKRVIEGDATRSENMRATVFDLYKNGMSSKMPSCKGTLWGAVAALVEYSDNYQVVRASKVKNEIAARIHSRLSGSGAELKAKAILVSSKLHTLAMQAPPLRKQV